MKTSTWAFPLCASSLKVPGSILNLAQNLMVYSFFFYHIVCKMTLRIFLKFSFWYCLGWKSWKAQNYIEGHHDSNWHAIIILNFEALLASYDLSSEISFFLAVIYLMPPVSLMWCIFFFRTDTLVQYISTHCRSRWSWVSCGTVFSSCWSRYAFCYLRNEKGTGSVMCSDQSRFLGNCPPTPPVSHHFALSVNVNVSLGEG